MKKIVVLLFLSITIFSSCEKDDFCIQNPVTPNLIIEFYDANNRETLKNFTSLTVSSESAENNDNLFENITRNRLEIPLNQFATETVYNFSQNGVDNQFTIKYSTEDVYVSRSCGFRVIFNDISFESENTWIRSFTPETLSTIDNQNETHVQIFH
jgi:hypothetical protein